MISLRVDWSDLLVVQETLKSLLQHRNSKAPVLQCSAFFMAQVSYYCSGFPFPSPEDLPDSGIEPGSPALYTDALPSEPPGKSYPYMTTGKTIDLTRWTFVDKGLSLLFNMFSRFVIAFLQRSKSLLISWLQSPSAVILEPQKTKSVTVSIVSPSICHEVMGLGAVILVF